MSSVVTSLKFGLGLVSTHSVHVKQVVDVAWRPAVHHCFVPIPV